MRKILMCFSVFIFLTLSINISAQEECSNPIGLAYSFVKAISTKDKVLLEEIVENELFIKSINLRFREQGTLSFSGLCTFLFLKYSPWKLRKGSNIRDLREGFLATSNFQIHCIKKHKEKYIIEVSWDDVGLKEYFEIHIKYWHGTWKVLDFYDPSISYKDSPFSFI